MAGDYVKNKRDGVLYIGDDGANELEIGNVENGLQYTYTRASQEYMPRGKHSDPPFVRLANDSNATGQLNVAFTDADGTLAILTNGGIPSGWVPTNGAGAEVPLWKLWVIIEGTDQGDPSDYKILLNHTEIKGHQFSEGDWDMWQISFESHAQPAFSQYP